MGKHKGPKVLIFDIETSPIIAHVWSLWDNNVALNQIEKDWNVLSWSAKWLDPETEIYKKNRKPKLMYMDLRKQKNTSEDKKILKAIRDLLDEADIVITQNGVDFDQKKLFARFVLNKIKRPSSFKHIDTAKIARKHFAFTSNKLEYMTDKLCTRYKKLKHKKFPGHEMWTECMKGNKQAWNCMEEYNKYDVLALEELYYKLIPWDSTINFNLYHDEPNHLICTCGHTKFKKIAGHRYTAKGKFARFMCLNCGKETRGTENLFSKEKRKSLHMS